LTDTDCCGKLSLADAASRASFNLIWLYLQQYKQQYKQYSPAN
jgi:hypothetical protein